MAFFLCPNFTIHLFQKPKAKRKKHFFILKTSFQPFSGLVTQGKMAFKGKHNPLLWLVVVVFLFIRIRWLSLTLSKPKTLKDFSTNLEPFIVPRCFYFCALHAYIII
jgi:hypothetical protein